MGSFWSDFLDNITPDSPETLSKPFAAGMTAVAGFADRVVPDEYQTRTFTPSSYMAGYVSDNRMADRARPNVAGQVFKPIAMLTMGPVEFASGALAKAESLGYGRPTSVVAQSMNRFNPLYEDGLQLSDFKTMWDKSRNDQWEGLRGDSPGISPAQAAWWGVLSGVKAVGAARNVNEAGNAALGVLSFFAPT